MDVRTLLELELRGTPVAGLVGLVVSNGVVLVLRTGVVVGVIGFWVVGFEDPKRRFTRSGLLFPSNSLFHC